MESIRNVQNEIWDTEFFEGKDIDETLKLLAYDLDFYKPDKELRKEDTSHYGDERLQTIIDNALSKL